MRISLTGRSATVHRMNLLLVPAHGAKSGPIARRKLSFKQVLIRDDSQLCLYSLHKHSPFANGEPCPITSSATITGAPRKSLRWSVSQSRFPSRCVRLINFALFIGCFAIRLVCRVSGSHPVSSVDCTQEVGDDKE